MKKVFLFAAIAALFAACSSKDEVVKDDSTQQPLLEKGAIGFDVYTQKATTRAGWAGSLTTTALQTNSTNLYEKANGFGVFGYYTDNNEYEQRSVPNFMYNQQVKWKADDTNDTWQYTPIVYWPNEYGSNATSDDQDKLTFFAYAPYVKVIPTSGKVANTKSAPDDDTKYQESYGITGMTKNTTQGDPILKYIASFDNKKSVDLCWGVADKGDGAAWNIVQTGNPQTEIKDGMPWIDLERPAGVDQRVRFTFKHATAQMRVSIDADVDVDGRGHIYDVAKKTRIWVREVKFKGFTMKGSLNLNNEDAGKPKWLDYNGQNELVAEDVTIYDGRKDGKEGVAGAIATNEKTLGLNPAIIQDGVYEKGDGTSVYDKAHDVVVYGVDDTGATNTGADWARPGVTKTTVNLFRCNNDDNHSQKDAMTNDEFFHVIPVNDNFEVEIVYDVETVDENLAQSLSDGVTKGSSIENRISKAITFGSDIKQIQAGHSYTLALHLGMNSVKFDAAVTDWIDEAAQDVDLPLNTPVFKAEKPVPSTATDVTLPYTGNYTFAITGLDGGESVKIDPEDPFVVVPQTGDFKWSVTKNNANTSGTAIQTVTTKVNPTTADRNTVVTWTGNQSNKGVKMNFIQKAHPLFMQITKTENNTDGKGVITLTRYNNETHKSSTDWTKDGGTTPVETGWFRGADGTVLSNNDTEAIKVWRNGAKLTWEKKTGTPSAGSKYVFGDDGVASTHTAQITIGEALKAGDVITVELTTGNAPTETVTTTIGGFAYVPATQSIIWRESYKYPVSNFYPKYLGKETTEPTWYGTITIDPENDAVAKIVSDEIQTTGLGTVTLKAVSNVTFSGCDVNTTSTLSLTVKKQDSKFSGSFADKIVAKPQSYYVYSDIPKEIYTFDPGVKAIGKEDESHVLAGNVTFEVVSVKKGGVVYNTNNIYFPYPTSGTESLRNRLATKETLEPNTTYEIVVKASHPGEAHYNATEDTVTITLNVGS